VRVHADEQAMSRRARWRCIHSIWSAYTFGVLDSTVEGRLMIILLAGVGTPGGGDGVAMVRAKSSSVVENDSGVYSKPQCVSRMIGATSCLTRRVPFTAMPTMSSRSC
jgi:hypothetical protein